MGFSVFRLAARLRVRQSRVIGVGFFSRVLFRIMIGTSVVHIYVRQAVLMFGRG